MDPSTEAIKLLEEVGIDSLPIIPRDICSQLHIEYVENPLKDLDGILLIDNDLQGMICVNSSITKNGRKNFTGAHEIGHLCLDALGSTMFSCPRSVIGSNSAKNLPEELRANEFAAELLMPKFIYQDLVDNHEPGWDNIKKLSEMSQTSDLATMIRYLNLTEESCALVVCENDKIAWYRKSKNFGLFIDMDSRFVSSGTPSFMALQGESPENSFESVNADNWVSGKQLNKYSEILEWSLPMNHYGQVLTLLYDEDGLGDIEDDDDSCLSPKDDVWVWEPPTFHKSKRKG